jgi:hypothetical protein
MVRLVPDAGAGRNLRKVGMRVRWFVGWARQVRQVLGSSGKAARSGSGRLVRSARLAHFVGFLPIGKARLWLWLQCGAKIIGR